MIGAFFLRCFILSQLLILHSADECVSTQFGEHVSIRFPFANKTSSDCGLCMVDNCIDPVQRIQLKKGGEWYPIRSWRTGNFITILHLDLEKLFDSGNCKSLINLSNLLANTNVLIYSNTTIFTCNHTLELIKLPSDFKHANCLSYNFYYGQNENITIPGCSVVHLPSLSSTGYKFIFLADPFSIEVNESSQCFRCNEKTGPCKLDSRHVFCDAIKPGMDKPTVEENLETSAGKGQLVLTVGLGTGLIAIVILITSVSIWYCRRRCPFTDTVAPNNHRGPYQNSTAENESYFFGVPEFSYTDLEEATENFDQTRVLGEGGYGTVYYGKLKDGREVAVKRLYEHNYRRIKQFINEIQILTQQRHKNLVALYGCTPRHSRELLLVYEYIPNGTVADHLHGNQAQPGSPPWSIRMNIAIETAGALAYLHASDIVHRDVKTNNILLDNNFSVKVADFGLSRLFPGDATHVSTAPQGTPGYLDPQYHQCYRLTCKSDVYSFGVVLIELLTSMPAVDITRHGDEISLANLATKMIKNRALKELVDPSLGFYTDNEVQRMTTLVAELAFQCLQPDKEMRPSMDEVLKTLTEIVNVDEETNMPENTNMRNEDVSDSTQEAHLPSPDFEEVALLKSESYEAHLSPISVAHNWGSTSTTPNTSA